MRRWKTAPNPRDPGVWGTCANFYPTSRGSYKTAPIFTALGTAAAGPTSGTTLGAYAFHDASGTLVTYVTATDGAFYASATNFQAGTFTSACSAVVTASQWSLCQYGNYTIATNGNNPVKARDSTTAGTFSDLSGSPPAAKIAITQNNAVLLFNLTTAGKNCWAASDVGSHVTWDGTGDSVTYTPILHRPGEITAAVAFRDHIIVFKKSSVYRMQYVGSPIFYTVELLDDTRGVTALGSVCNCGDFVIFSGAHGTTIFDGSGFRDISQGFELESGLSNLAFNVGTDAMSYFPAERNLVIHSNGSNAWVYNLTNDSWGYFSYYKSGTTAQVNLMGLQGTPSARADAIGGIAGDMANGGLCLVNLGANPCVLKSSDSWTPDSSILATIGTTFVGDERRKTLFTRVTPVSSNAFVNSFPAATGMTLTAGYGDRPEATNSLAAVTSSTLSHRFDLLGSQSLTARYANFNIRVTGASYEIEDVIVESKDAGTD